MSIRHDAQQALAGISGPLPQTLALDAPGVRLRCNLTAIDSLAVAFDALHVEVDALAAADIEQLKAASDRLAARLSYLLEAIATVEVDRAACTVLLRSSPPQQNADATSYYELLVKQGGQLHLARFAKSVGDTARRRIACEVTREVFGRLAEDLAAA
jgi:hypothetical protein